MPYVVGAASLVGVWLLCLLLSKQLSPLEALRQLSTGDDNSVSASKFQFVLWTGVAVFSFMTIWYARARNGDYSPLETMPENLLALMGISAGSAIASKGIVTYQLSQGTRSFSRKGRRRDSWFKYLVCGEDGTLELCRLQMIAWTFIAISIYILQVIDQVESSEYVLPDVAATMLVLMGISQGAYVGKKLVSTTTPNLRNIDCTSVGPNDVITLTGANFGDEQANGIVKIDELVLSEDQATQSKREFYPNKVTEWKDDKITFIWPSGLQLGAHNISVVIGSKESNPLTTNVKSLSSEDAT